MHANVQADICAHTQYTQISYAVFVRHTLMMFTHADMYVMQILIGEAGM